MAKNNKRGKTLGEVIEEIIFNAKEEMEETTEGIERVKEQIEQIEEEKNRAMGLQEDVKFFKATLVMAESIVKTIESARKEGREIDVVSMSEILTEILVVLEERGFIKIIEED
jgi:hypothetical protein